MGSKTFTSMQEARKFARAKISAGYQTVNLFSSGTPRTKGYKVVVRFADKE